MGGKTCLTQVRNINKGTKANKLGRHIKYRHLVFNSIRGGCIRGGRTREFFVITRPIQRAV
jgi:hypothetical protein